MPSPYWLRQGHPAQGDDPRRRSAGPAVPGEGLRDPRRGGVEKKASGRPSGAPRDPGTPGPPPDTAGPRREGLM